MGVYQEGQNVSSDKDFCEPGNHNLEYASACVLRKSTEDACTTDAQENGSEEDKQGCMMYGPSAAA